MYPNKFHLTSISARAVGLLSGEESGTEYDRDTDGRTPQKCCECPVRNLEIVAAFSAKEDEKREKNNCAKSKRLI